MNMFRFCSSWLLFSLFAAAPLYVLGEDWKDSEYDSYMYRETPYSSSASKRAYTHFIPARRSFDNSDFFSAGISSYQGTSTGPGPNGGYPGAPRGVYPTRYIDTSIYPNSYSKTD